jgi:hypothetical protein
MQPATSFQSVTSLASSAREHGGGEIGAAAAERDDLAVAAGADEARHDDDEPAVEQGLDRGARARIGAREIGRRVAGPSVGVDELLRVGHRARNARALERGGEHGRGEPLAARENLVAHVRRALTRAGHPVEQPLELLERFVDPLAHGGRVEHDLRRHRVVPRPQLARDRERGVEVPCGRLRARLHERVGHAQQRGGGHDASRARAVEREEPHDAGDRAGVGERGSPELVDDDGTCWGGHG